MLSIFQYVQVHTPAKSGDLRALPLVWPHTRRAVPCRAVATVHPSRSPGDVHDHFVRAIRAVFRTDGQAVAA